MLGHGRTNAELLRGMWEHDEARAIEECTEVIEKHVGVRPTGWMGPGALESNVTPDLLKEAGYTHLLDWPFDDQPIWMQTRAGPLLSVPYPMELNDAGTLAHRDHTGREFADMIVDQFEEMLEQSERQPLVFALALHGFIVGQPFRLRPLRQAIKHCVEHKRRIASGSRAPAISRSTASRCRRASFPAVELAGVCAHAIVMIASATECRHDELRRPRSRVAALWRGRRRHARPARATLQVAAANSLPSSGPPGAANPRS